MTNQKQGAPGDDVLIEVHNLKTFYPSRSGFLKRSTEWVKAVNGVSLQIHRGETFGPVGESGCGKSSLGRSILRLETPQEGDILFQGENILTASPSRLKSIRRDVQAVFQDPRGSLDPRMSARGIISEGLVVQGQMGRRERREFVEHLIALVGLRKEHLHPIADPQSPFRSAERIRPDLPVHRPRPLGRRIFQRSGRRNVSRQTRRTG